MDIVGCNTWGIQFDAGAHFHDLGLMMLLSLLVEGFTGRFIIFLFLVISENCV